MQAKILSIASEITKKTDNNAVRWNDEDNISSEEFSAKIGNTPVAILSYNNNETGRHSFVFKVFSSATGQLAGQVSFDDDEVGYFTLERLFESAMANARDLDSILEDMQNTLGDLEEHV